MQKITSLRQYDLLRKVTSAVTSCLFVGGSESDRVPLGAPLSLAAVD
jgi:hypothetical protein